MIHIDECCWKGAKSAELHGKIFIPDDTIRAFIIMVHGIGEHGGCYHEWGEKFVLQSIGFLAFDLRGHGKTQGIRGHASMRLIQKDIQTIVLSVQKRFPAVPVVLFGHSMGGQTVLTYITGKQVEVQGAIASSPYLKPVYPRSPLLVWLVRLASCVVPCLTVRTGIRADQLSHDGGTKSSKKDPLMHKKISIKLFSDLCKNSKRLLRGKHKLNVPLLLMHGSDDPLVSFKAGKSFVQHTEGSSTFKFWHGMRHDLLFDEGNEAVFQYVMKWLTKHIIKNGNIQNHS